MDTKLIEGMAALGPADLRPAGPVVERGLFVQPPEGWGVFPPVMGENRSVQFVSPDWEARLNVSVQDDTAHRGDVTSILIAAAEMVGALGSSVQLAEVDLHGPHGPCGVLSVEATEQVTGRRCLSVTVIKAADGKIGLIEAIFFSEAALREHGDALQKAAVEATWVADATGVTFASA